MLFALRPGTTTYVTPATWPYDQYPQMPELRVGQTVTILEAAGPGVVESIHASMYLRNSGMGADPYGESYPFGARILLRVYYDGAAEPDIEMPFYAFLGDMHPNCGFYAAGRFSKVPMSHNFRLEMPFGREIRLELTNPTVEDLMGYTDVQYRKEVLPPHCGRLRADHRFGSFTVPEETLCLFAHSGRGAIAAHWLLLEGRAEGFRNGEGLCEGNCSFYLNGEMSPACQYLGVEDLYGYSWGFQGCHSDGQCAILVRDQLDPGARIGLLRCRDADPIRYETGCRMILDYRQEYFSARSVNPIHREHPVFSVRPRYSAPVQYRSCFYYYCEPQANTSRSRLG